MIMKIEEWNLYTNYAVNNHSWVMTAAMHYATMYVYNACTWSLATSPSILAGLLSKLVSIFSST